MEYEKERNNLVKSTHSIRNNVSRDSGSSDRDGRIGPRNPRKRGRKGGQQLKRKGVSLPINTTTELAIGVLGAAFFVAVMLQVLSSVEGAGACGGPAKYLMSAVADLTGQSPC